MMKAGHIQNLTKPIAHTYSEMFSGQVYRVGKGAVSVRNHSGKAVHTIICVHGFLANHCYFTDTYEAPTTQLILLTCSNYHIPVNGVTVDDAPWNTPIKPLEGTVEYDACILNQALVHLPSTSNIRIHGHSRGAAVILEAIIREPELYRHVEIVLETPVLPQGRLHPMATTILNHIGYGMWPFLIQLINSTPSSVYRQAFFGSMNPRKKLLLKKVFSATRDPLTIVRNIENVIGWMERGFHLTLAEVANTGILKYHCTERISHAEPRYDNTENGTGWKTQTQEQRRARIAFRLVFRLNSD